MKKYINSNLNNSPKINRSIIKIIFPKNTTANLNEAPLTQRNAFSPKENIPIKKRNLSMEVSDFIFEKDLENQPKQAPNERFSLKLDLSKVNQIKVQNSPKQILSNPRKEASSHKKESKLLKLKRKFLEAKTTIKEREERIRSLESANKLLLEKMCASSNSKNGQNDQKEFETKMKFFKRVYCSKIDSLNQEIKTLKEKNEELVSLKSGMNSRVISLESNYNSALETISALRVENKLLLEENAQLKSDFSNLNEKQTIEESFTKVSEKSKENILKSHLLLANLFSNEMKNAISKIDLPVEFLFADHNFLFKKIENANKNTSLKSSIEEIHKFSSLILESLSDNVYFLKNSQNSKYGEECLFGAPIFPSK